VKLPNWSLHRLAVNLLITVLVCGTIGTALKFTVFFDSWVYFPMFPNMLGNVFLIVSVVVLAWLIKKQQRQ